METKDLSHRISELKEYMDQVINLKKDLTCSEVLGVSIELDELVNIYMERYK